MKEKRKIFFSLAAMALSSCGTGYSRPAAQLSPSANRLSVLSFNPPSSTVETLPASVVITFSASSLKEGYGAASATLLSNYWLSCVGNNFQPSAVTYVAGTASVAVTLPPIAGLAPGTSCTFRASGDIQDTNGNALQAPASATYVVTGFSSGWVESGSVSATDAAGGSGGLPFEDAAANGLVLTGLQLHTSTYVDGITGQFQEAFQSGGSSSTGEAHGTSSSTSTQLSCPGGYALTGLSGRADQYVNALGITCKNQDGSQTFSSAVTGGPGGSSFSLNCPSGMFATNLRGRSGSAIDQISLGCR